MQENGHQLKERVTLSGYLPRIKAVYLPHGVLLLDVLKKLCRTILQTSRISQQEKLQ